MLKTGPIVLVEDDRDDQEIIAEVFKSIQVMNPIAVFKNGQEALDYLKNTAEKPFLILCDINMPVMDGLQFRAAIEADASLKRKCIPFIFLSTTNNPTAVRKAYDLTIQGFFQKRNTIQELGSHLKMIVDYWDTCLQPEPQDM